MKAGSNIEKHFTKKGLEEIIKEGLEDHNAPFVESPDPWDQYYEEYCMMKNIRLTD